jgi:anthranilate phosphoribosyltransferase
VINAATALMAAGKATSFQDGADMAKESIESGAAKAALAKLVKVSQAAA